MLKNLQVLRAIAALLVVTLHIQDSAGAAGGVAYATGYGAFGVDIFFVISGFIMFHTTAGFKRSGTEFLLDRAIRILPLYWIATLTLLVLVTIGFRPIGVNAIGGVDLATSLMLVPRILSGPRQPVLLTPGWTLIFEMFFYVVFAATFFVRSHRRSFLLMFVVFSGVVLLRTTALVLIFSLRFFMDSIVYEFLYGCALAMLLPFFATRRSWAVLVAGYALVVGGFVALAAVPSGSLPHGFDLHARAVVAGVPALAIVGGALMLERCGHVWTWRPLVMLGTASYSLYLFHPLVLQPATKIARRIVPLHGWPMVVALTVFALALACGLAILVHLAVERPLTQWLRRRLTRPLTRTEPLAGDAVAALRPDMGAEPR